MGGMPNWYTTKLALLALPSVIFEPRFRGSVRNLVYTDQPGVLPRRQEMRQPRDVKCGDSPCDHTDVPKEKVTRVSTSEKFVRKSLPVQVFRTLRLSHDVRAAVKIIIFHLESSSTQKGIAQQRDRRLRASRPLPARRHLHLHRLGAIVRMSKPGIRRHLLRTR